MCETEVETTKHRSSLALEAKNREIRRFQLELEQILTAAAQMHSMNQTLAPPSALAHHPAGPRGRAGVGVA